MILVARVDYRDVAEAAALALTDDRLVNGTFELCAGGYYDRNEVASLIGEVLGRPVKAATVSFEEWVEIAKVRPDQARPQRDMYDYYGRQGSPGNALVLRSLLGREPRTLRQFLQDLVDGRPVVAA